MLKGFKDFVMRGNLVELAVAFVIGAAFATVVTATVALIMDLVGKVGGTPDFSSYSPGGISIGAWLTAVISFLIMAAVVYFLVVTPYNKLQERMSRGEEPTPPAPDIALLTEIRDLLAGRAGSTNVRGGGGLS
ncbi:large conductance mechanosensitive channel protein MscL [Nocardioides panacis]|jgi:large conductance mechanosensitive channel|uniref:Large-conductance mechanosensitive channel n=1 Tax=Nocardioides panacis TaxID=2849501 RepID=A0A975Y0D1_9ACTN|nr:large conductance mechanosensitive channel protein MscL [Nocardioides panacis]QWZ08323.1 large conductance mechanosensitive channel protein MscL [Nocardioides panacis]QWZ08348.1 large conductance mechanosensitive channel protein MscL [Nocardioides panacis]